MISLSGPDAVLGGDTISNSSFGTIQGQGLVSNSISNSGTVRAVGGALDLSGGSISNGNSGTIESAAGTSIVVTQGLAVNSGLIALTGGSFDNGGHALANSNSGSILGNGTFSTGGLSNSGSITFSDSNSSIFGAVTNSSGGTLLTYGTSATNISFYGAVKNSGSAGSTPAGYIKITGTTVRWLGGFTNNGTYVSDPAANYFSGLAVGAGGLLQGGAGDSFFVTGTFTNAGDIDLGGSSRMLVQNGGTLAQTSGVLHLGSSATLTAGVVEINGGTLLADGPTATITSSLIYASSSASTYQGVLTGAGSKLTLDNPAALLILSGASNSYTGGTYVEAGTLEITNQGAIPDGSSLTVGADAAALFAGAATLFAGAATPQTAAAAAAVPEPCTLVLCATAVCGAAVYRGIRLRKKQQ